MDRRSSSAGSKIYSSASQTIVLRRRLARDKPFNDRTQELNTHPQPGYRYSASTRHVRIIRHEHYRTAYLLKDDGNIDIPGVFHGSLDITKYQL